jgi:predicted RNA-binding Zn ribbon-like protein
VAVSTWTELPGESSSVALALVNTRFPKPGEEIVERLATVRDVEQWLATRSLRAGPPAAVRKADVARLGALRAAIRELFTARIEGRVPDEGARTLVNEASAASRAAAQIEWPADGPRRVWAAEPRFAGVLADIADDAIEVLTGPAGETLRMCAASRCVRLFLRQHARRTWCSTACGDRVRAARHYERVKARMSPER